MVLVDDKTLDVDVNPILDVVDNSTLDESIDDILVGLVVATAGYCGGVKITGAGDVIGCDATGE